MSGLFVTGTDTGVGKTVVSCALIRSLLAEGLRVSGMKPVETGVGPDGPLDAQALQAAAGGGDDLEIVCPQRFALAAAPSVAARAEGRRVCTDTIRSAFAQLAGSRDMVVVEGAGGLLVPLTDSVTMADLAAMLQLRLVVVARAALGTINHTRLTVEAAEARGLPVLGVVVSHAGGALEPADADNLSELRAWLGDLLLGEIPPLASSERPSLRAIRLEPILKRAAQLRVEGH